MIWLCRKFLLKRSGFWHFFIAFFMAPQTRIFVVMVHLVAVSHLVMFPCWKGVGGVSFLRQRERGRKKVSSQRVGELWVGGTKQLHHKKPCVVSLFKKSRKFQHKPDSVSPWEHRFLLNCKNFVADAFGTLGSSFWKGEVEGFEVVRDVRSSRPRKKLSRFAK